MPEIRRRNGRNAEDALLDEVNLRLLAELQTDARASASPSSDVASGCPSPAVAERIARLEQEQIIVGYHARLNPRALGFRAQRRHPCQARSSAIAPGRRVGSENPGGGRLPADHRG